MWETQACQVTAQPVLARGTCCVLYILLSFVTWLSWERLRCITLQMLRQRQPGITTSDWRSSNCGVCAQAPHSFCICIAGKQIANAACNLGQQNSNDQLVDACHHGLPVAGLCTVRLVVAACHRSRALLIWSNGIALIGCLCWACWASCLAVHHGGPCRDELASPV